MDANTAQISTRNLQSIWVLSLGGFIPFAVLSFVIWAEIDFGYAISPIQLFLFWSAMILSFLGGIRWGMAIVRQPVEIANIILSVLPCIIAWFSMLLAARYSLIILLILYLLHGWWDYRNLSSMPWFAKLRLMITILVASAHMVVLWVLL